MPYLLVAEVDKIQSFIMRSSKLRQVVGASAMLEDFGAKVRANSKDYLGQDVPEELIFASAGGSFRIGFETAAEVEQAGNILKARFEKDVGGSITVAPPVEWLDDDKVIEDGNDALRTTKTGGRDPIALWHLPYHALCQSSGMELAYKYDTETNFSDDTNMKYLGELTLKKGKWTQDQTKKDEEGSNTVLDKMLKSMRDVTQRRIHLPKKATDAETYAQGEARQYVAYLVADGNHMGKVFNACTPHHVKMLSQKMEVITREALAEAAQYLNAVWGNPNRLPFLPLIMGGDDIFALMPAPWAFDIAMRYCHLYQDRMQAVWDEPVFDTKGNSVGSISERLKHKYYDQQSDDKKEVITPTLGMAIIICKASYPYKTSHDFGEGLLSHVKDVGKQVAKVKGKNGEPLPAETRIGIDWIIGGQVKTSARSIAFELEDAGKLLYQRHRLTHLESRFRQGVRQDIENNNNLDQRLARYRELHSDELNQQLVEAFQSLGLDGMYQLFTLWDFLFDTQYQPTDYLREGEYAS